MSLIKVPVMQFDETDGNPLRFAKAYFSEHGTTTPVATYQDFEYLTPHVGSYVQADGDGMFPAIYIDPALGLVRIRVIAEDGDLNDPLIDVDPINHLAVSVYDLEIGSSVVYPVSMNRLGGDPPITGELLNWKIWDRPVRIPADWDSPTLGHASGWQITPPADDDMVITVRKGTVGVGGTTDIGTITVTQTTGEWTWVTTGNVEVDFATDDYIAFYFTGGVADASWLDLVWVFVAQVTGAPA